MPSKGFRDLDHDELLPSGTITCLSMIPMLAVLAGNVFICLGLLQVLQPLKLADLPADVWAELVYMLGALAAALIIDAKVLVQMFFHSRIWTLNWMAGGGVFCSVLKLSMVNRVQNYDTILTPSLYMAYDLVSGRLQLNSLVRDGSSQHWEAMFGNACCMYLAAYFTTAALGNQYTDSRRLPKKSALCIGLGVILGAFSGFFAPQNVMKVGWLPLCLVILVACTYSSRVLSSPPSKLQ
mmetsp:Transcript_31461/g.57149  ORF Transcript_31461/g.57149 Transcript_31461/m.57149 type:complete len:238 (+) Transcript_31461:54-767(+)